MSKKLPLVLSNIERKNTTNFWRAYKQFWPFIKPVWPIAILGILLSIPVGALDAVIAAFLKPFMDKVMIEQQKSFADYVPIVIISFTFLQGLFIYLSSYVNGYVGGRINLNIKNKLYEKLIRLETRFFDVNNSGSIIYRFSNDVDMASTGLIANIRLFLTKFFSSVSLVVVLIYNSWQLSLFAIGILIFLVIPLRIVRKKIKKIVDKSVVGNTEIITLYNETSQGSRVIKSFNLIDSMIALFRKRSDFLFRINLKMIRDTNWLSPIMHLVSSIGVAGVLYFGVQLILTQQITSGSFVAFLAALIMLYTPLKSIGNNFINLQQAMLAIDRIYEILGEESYEEEKGKDNKELLELTDIKDSIVFKDVNFAYTEDRLILKDLSFKVECGKKVALVGNSGGGKTTVCSLIPRLYDIDSGEIFIDGHNIKDYSLKSLRNQISIVFQDCFLFQGTIRENIMCSRPDATEEELNKVLDEAYLTDFLKTLPLGLDTTIGERGMTLSGGQKQRVSIARAMLKNAPLVILDEATSALDNKSEKVVQKALDKLMQSRTTIVIAHRLSTIQDADVIMVINNGSVVEQGNHATLLAKNGAYASLYNSQFKLKEKEA